MAEAIELYLHIPFCVRKCLYCDFNSHVRDRCVQERYAKALATEIAWWGKVLGKRLVSSVFFGGGTPTCLAVDLLEDLMQAIRTNFCLQEEAEISLEMNPGTGSRLALERYRAMGFNRLSLGLQSVHEEELALLGRIHSYEDFLLSFEQARRAGFANINVDLMTGLPGQDLVKLKGSLQKVCRLRPEHISCYSLIVEPGTPFYELYHADVLLREKGRRTRFLPDEEEELALCDFARNYLREQGFLAYEVSNFAKEGFACRHNLGYWERKPYLGMGLGAASLLYQRDLGIAQESSTALRQGNYADLRFSNIRDLDDYIRLWEHYQDQLIQGHQSLKREELLAEIPWIDADSIQKLSAREAMEEFVFLGLRKRVGVREADFLAQFGISIESVFGKILREQEQEGYLLRQGGQIAFCERGMDLSNILLAQYIQ